VHSSSSFVWSIGIWCVAIRCGYGNPIYSARLNLLAQAKLELVLFLLLHSLFSPRSQLCTYDCFCIRTHTCNICRIGTAEIEAALASHPAVSEAAVVGFPDAIKGQGMCCYVSLVADAVDSPELIKELRLQVLTL
jgi:AMP-binding enzyme C-terminal domain